MLFWIAIFKQFLQASEGTKNALIASSFLHTLLHGISAASVTKLPVLQKHCIFYTWKNLRYLKIPPSVWEANWVLFNVLNFWLCLDVWGTLKDFVFVFFFFSIQNMEFSIKILPHQHTHEEGKCHLLKNKNRLFDVLECENLYQGLIRQSKWWMKNEKTFRKHLPRTRQVTRPSHFSIWVLVLLISSRGVALWRWGNWSWEVVCSKSYNSEVMKLGFNPHKGRCKTAYEFLQEPMALSLCPFHNPQ